MSRGSVLVIDDDEWVGRLLAVALREAGYEVVCSPSAVEGFDKAVEIEPDCIICDVDLPDVDGFWVARKIRMSADRVSVTPFLFLSGLDDRDTRLQGFHVGADVYMTKPFRIDEVVAQVGALVQMASRLRQSRKTFLSVPPTEAAMIGDIAQMSVATVLTLLDMERRSGKLEVANKEHKAVLFIVAGAIGGATMNEEKRDPLELLRTLLAWTHGRFAFHPDTSETKAGRETSINALLMEAVRLEDELREGLEGAAPPKSDPSSRRPPRMPRVIPSSIPAEPPPPPGPDSGKLSLDMESGWSEPPPPPSKSEAAPAEPPKETPGAPAIASPTAAPPAAPAAPAPNAVPPAPATPKPGAPQLAATKLSPPGARTSTSTGNAVSPLAPNANAPSTASNAQPPGAPGGAAPGVGSPGFRPPFGLGGAKPGAPAPPGAKSPVVGAPRPPIGKSPSALPSVQPPGAQKLTPPQAPNKTPPAAPPSSPGTDATRTPGAQPPTGLRPSPARAVPAVPPNPRVGQGSGEK